jgi:hypothetical protein
VARGTTRDETETTRESAMVEKAVRWNMMVEVGWVRMSECGFEKERVGF